MNHPCHLCGAAFKQIAKLKSHLILHKEEKTYKCQFCDKLFSKSSNLYSHIRTHTGEKPFQCLVCSRFFPRMNTLRAHIVKQHQISNKEADQLIIAHERTNSEDTGKVVKKEPSEGAVKAVKKGSYEGADKVLKKEPQGRAGKVVKKEPAVGAEGDASSKVVEQAIAVRDTEFYTIHTDTVIYTEGVSEATDSLTKRVYYKCKTCAKSMSHKSNMEDHVRSHSGIKLFQCSLCGKGLSRKQNLVHHLKHVHFIENSKIDQNIVRLNSPKTQKATPKTAKKDKRNVFKPLEVDKRNNALEANDISVSSKPLKYNLSPNDSFSNIDEGNEEEKQIMYEPGEVVCLIPKPEGFDLGRKDTESDKTISCEMNGEKTESDNEHLPSKSHSTADGDEKMEKCETGKCETEKCETEKCETEAVLTSQLFDRTPDIFTKLDEFCLKINNQLYSESENNVVENDIQSKIDETFPVEDRVNEMPENSELQVDNLDIDKTYIVLNPDNPSLKSYKCTLCDFECKRRYYMAEVHILKHTNYKPYLCVVCCKPYSRKYTLRCHLSKEHKIDGAELDEIMVATGSKVCTSLPPTVTSKLNTGSNSKTHSDKIKKPKEEHNNSVSSDKRKHNKCNESVGSKYFGKMKDGATMDDTSINESSMDEKSSEVKLSQSKEDPLCKTEPAIAGSVLHTVSSFDASEGESPPRKKRKTMAQDINTIIDSLGNSPDIPKSLINNPGTLPSFYSSVYNLITSRQPKKACLYNDKFNEYMDLKNLTCRKCNKKCSNKSNLKQHIKFVHLNFKEFACYVCGKKFNTKFNLKVHWKQHSDLVDRNLKENFACKKCGKTFTTKSYLKVHIVNKHGVSKSRVQPQPDTTDSIDVNISHSEDNNKDVNHVESATLSQYCSENTNMEMNHAENAMLSRDSLEHNNIDLNPAENTNMDRKYQESATLGKNHSENTNMDLNCAESATLSKDCSEDTKMDSNHAESATLRQDCSENTNMDLNCAESATLSPNHSENTKMDPNHAESATLRQDCSENTNMDWNCSQSTTLSQKSNMVYINIDCENDSNSNSGCSDSTNLDQNHAESATLNKNHSNNTNMDRNLAEHATQSQDCSETSNMDLNHSQSTTLSQKSDKVYIDIDCENDTNSNSDCSDSSSSTLACTDDFNSETDCAESDSEKTNLIVDSTECTSVNTDCTENTNPTSIQII